MNSAIIGKVFSIEQFNGFNQPNIPVDGEWEVIDSILCSDTRASYTRYVLRETKTYEIIIISPQYLKKYIR